MENFSTIVNAAAFAIVFALVGAFVPRASSTLLQWRRRSYEQWFETSASDAAAYRLEHGRAPSSKASGHEGALGIWEESLRRMAGDRALSQGQARRAVEAVGDGAFSEGFDIGSLPSDASLREEFSVASSPKTVVPCAVVLAALGVAGALMGMGPVAGVLYAAMTGLCAVVALCDLKSRTIPFVLPLILAVLAALFWLVAAGLQGLAYAALIALIAAVLLVVVSFIGTLLRGRMPMGVGDLVTMPAAAFCASLPGFVYGLLIGFFCGLVALIAARIVRKRPRDEKMVPLGPVFALCAATGVLFTYKAMASF